MSQKNVELVQKAYDAFSRGDAETIRELFPAEFVADFSRRLVDPSVLPREEALAALLSGTDDSWEALPLWEPLEVTDANDKVAALIRTTARGKVSGIEVEARVWNVWTFREGRPVELKYFGDDRAAALEAAGLSD
jgi:ketosteroid isomerase-like protein